MQNMRTGVGVSYITVSGGKLILALEVTRNRKGKEWWVQKPACHGIKSKKSLGGSIVKSDFQKWP